MTETDAVPLTGADKVAYAFYATAATAALVGQVWAGVTHIPWPDEGFSPFLKIALVTPAVAVIELGGVATAALADLRRRKGEQAYAYRAMSLFAAVVALVFNVVGHWRPEERFLAFGFGGLSAFAYVLWLIHSSARRRDALRKAGQMATTGPVYGVVQWAREPKVTWLARSIALEHGLGLYESLRAARVQLRNNARRDAIAGTVAEYIRSEHQDERLAKIAETTYDADRLAGMLEERINYEVVTNKLTLAISPPPTPKLPPNSSVESPAGGVGEKASSDPRHEHDAASNWWIAMAEHAGVTSFDPAAARPTKALHRTSWSAHDIHHADVEAAAQAAPIEERSSQQERGAPSAHSAPPPPHFTPTAGQERLQEHLAKNDGSQIPEATYPQVSTAFLPLKESLPKVVADARSFSEDRATDEGALLPAGSAPQGALPQERPAEERSRSSQTQGRSAKNAPQVTTPERSRSAPGRSAEPRKTAAKDAADTMWDEAKKLLDDWPTDTNRTGAALAKQIGGSPSYARKLIARYDQDKRPTYALELVRERSR